MSASTKKKLPPAGRTGDAHLKDLPPVKVELAHGEIVTLRLHEEFYEPKDPAEAYDEARKAPGRYAFWATQAAIALNRVRDQEAEVVRIQAAHDMQVRNNHQYRAMTERSVQSYVDLQPQLTEARQLLRSRLAAHDQLKSIADAMRQRCFILGNLTKPNVEAQMGA